MDEALTKTLKYLRLGGLLAHWDEYLALARRQRFSPVRLLHYVLEEELKLKRDNARQLRLKRAHIPELLDLATFPSTGSRSWTARRSSPSTMGSNI